MATANLYTVHIPYDILGTLLFPLGQGNNSWDVSTLTHIMCDPLLVWPVYIGTVQLVLKLQHLATESPVTVTVKYCIVIATTSTEQEEHAPPELPSSLIRGLWLGRLPCHTASVCYPVCRLCTPLYRL